MGFDCVDLINRLWLWGCECVALMNRLLLRTTTNYKFVINHGNKISVPNNVENSFTG